MAKQKMYKEWCDGLLKDLKEPFPVEVQSTKKRGSALLTFVSWYHYVKRLNELVGSGWSINDVTVQEFGGKVVVGVSVTILGVTRQNFGDEEAEKETYGTAITNAFAQGFKRTCSMFGLGLYLYEDEAPKW